MSFLQPIYSGFEHFFFDFHRYVYKARQHLYRKDKSFPVLFYSKQQFFNELSYTIPVFEKYITLFEKDISFLADLIDREEDSESEINKHFSLLQTKKAKFRETLAFW